MEFVFVLVTAIVSAVVLYLKERRTLSTEQLGLLLDLARTAVSAAETVGVGEGMSGDAKYKLAAEGLTELAARVGVELSDKEVAVLIHAVLPSIVPKFEDDLR